MREGRAGDARETRGALPRTPQKGYALLNPVTVR